MPVAASAICFLNLHGDVLINLNSWVATSGKNGMRRDWIVHDCKTGDILTRASRGTHHRDFSLYKLHHRDFF
ncbi:hypothetical protein CsSME_00011559 [Camellia sinensis var. sinensis]